MPGAPCRAIVVVVGLESQDEANKAKPQSLVAFVATVSVTSTGAAKRAGRGHYSIALGLQRCTVGNVHTSRSVIDAAALPYSRARAPYSDPWARMPRFAG